MMFYSLKDGLHWQWTDYCSTYWSAYCSFRHYSCR